MTAQRAIVELLTQLSPLITDGKSIAATRLIVTYTGMNVADSKAILDDLALAHWRSQPSGDALSAMLDREARRGPNGDQP